MTIVRSDFRRTGTLPALTIVIAWQKKCCKLAGCELERWRSLSAVRAFGLFNYESIDY
jgi:hypothetical protein